MFFLLYCLVVPLPQAQTDEDIPFVEIQISPEDPVLNAEWTVSLVVDHPVPAEVVVRAPALPNTLALQRVRTEGRIMARNSPAGRLLVRITVIEFLFFPHSTGMVRLDPFEVITPDKRVQTKAITRYIRGNTGQRYLTFTWEPIPPSLHIGEPWELSLRCSNWDPEQPLPETSVFLPELPEQAIVEARPLGDREGGIVLCLEVIPLETTLFILKPRQLQYEDLTLDVPGISIPVIPASAAEGEQTADVALLPEEAPLSPGLDHEPVAPIPFPEQSRSSGVFPLFRSDYERTLRQARSLWDQGQRAEALAELRRNERDSAVGPALVPLRREAEQRLGLAFTDDEPWRPRFLLLLLCLGSLGLVLVIMAPPLIRYYQVPAPKKAVTSSLSRGYKGILIILMVILGVTFYGLTERKITQGFRSGYGSDAGSAVLQATAAYRVPDGGGVVSAYFDEGQPVIIHSVSDSWVYVNSFDGRAGWVSRDTIVFY
ncbi:MAG: hypothetical protein LBU17_08825 [Treponema sp.]|nr:hypothetical protein [Treponema sp.]